jgi:tetratricopeptide (TPR) repeat protein
MTTFAEGHRAFTLAFALSSALLAFALPGSAFAAGDNDPPPTCKKGLVWDKAKGQCVPQQGSMLDDDALADYAYALTKDQRYEEALEILATLKNPDTAKALNYRGYATRKLGRTDEGIALYLRSVALDENYAQVREYLGEAYVIKGRLDLAREQLGKIQAICGNTTCEEYEDLAEAIEKPSAL